MIAFGILEFRPEMKFEIEVKCQECGELLDSTISQYGDIELKVEPCETCSYDKYKEGFSDGELSKEEN
jgi:hypothetical protein